MNIRVGLRAKKIIPNTGDFKALVSVHEWGSRSDV